mgnify:CR=1 FL=1
MTMHDVDRLMPKRLGRLKGFAFLDVAGADELLIPAEIRDNSRVDSGHVFKTLTEP